MNNCQLSISNYQLPKGYKQTEVGVIPEDWGYLPVGNFIAEFRGGAPLKPSDFTKNGVKVLPKGGVARGGVLTIDSTDLQFCSQEYADQYSKNQVDESYTIIVLRDLVPSGPSIGLIVKINEPEKYVLAQGVYGFKVTEDVLAEYLIQYSNSFPYRRLMNEIMVGSTQVHITNTAFKEAKLPFPPIKEQRAIAAILSDVDALIASLEKLIAKQRHLKTATMQQLLTGKKRLPGFGEGKSYKQTEVGLIPEDWDVLELGEIAKLVRGKFSARPRNDPRFFGGNIPFIQTGDVTQSNGKIDHYSQTLNEEGLSVSKLFPKGTLFFTIAANIGDMGIASFETACPDSLIAILPKPYIGKNWIFHALKFRKAEFEDLATQNAQLNINLEKLNPYLVAVPSLPEQRAIATVLSDMDAAISALETRRAKTQAIKQGMMQELLTGRTRLV